MNKNQKIAIAALLTFGVIGAGFVSAFPMGFRGINKELTAEELEVLSEERQKIIDAIENEDYETWKALMENKIEEMKLKLTEENFIQVVERHNQISEIRQLKQQIREAWENEDFETVAELKEQMNSLGKFGCPKGGFDGHKI